MESIKFRETKNTKAKFLGVVILIFGLLIILTEPIGIFIFLIGFLILTINTEIEVFKTFENKYNITLFSKTIFSKNKKLIEPNYISLFGQSFSRSNDFSTVSALGSTSSYDFYVIRFFDENNRNEIIFKSKNKTEVLEKGTQLAALLNVELLNKLEH